MSLYMCAISNGSSSTCPLHTPLYLSITFHKFPISLILLPHNRAIQLLSQFISPKISIQFSPFPFMADICCGTVVGDSESSCDTGSRAAARRRRMDLRRPSLVAGVAPADDASKRRRFDLTDNNNNPVVVNENEQQQPDRREMQPVPVVSRNSVPIRENPVRNDDVSVVFPSKHGVASVCGRRGDMEDAVAIHASFCRRQNDDSDAAFKTELHFYGVFDGHGCSHVATRCRERMHEVVREEVMAKENRSDTAAWWKAVMERSFIRMDKEVMTLNGFGPPNCRCELQTPARDAVGSTAVVAIMTPNYIVVANCGDSRAVLGRNGLAIPLSFDHKPDRPDELNRIQAAGGRVIYWEGARVLGVLAMSRAIGDSYLKPYVSCEPELTITRRSEEDECLVIASDGLWDVVSNETACGVARMCLRNKPPPPPPAGVADVDGPDDDRACSDAAMLLTKLALARRSADNVSVVVVDLRKPE